MIDKRKFSLFVSRVQSLRRLLIGITAVFLIAGCIPMLGTSEYYKYEIDLTANGRHYAFDYYYKCYKEKELSEADGKFHTSVRSSGQKMAAGDIGDDRVLLFGSGGCGGDLQELERKGIVVSHPLNPERLYHVENVLNDPSIIINHVTARRVESIDRDIGPTKEQIALMEVVSEHQHGFQYVTVAVIPYEKWATSEQNRQYFSRFKSLAIAEPGKQFTPQGNMERFSSFKLHSPIIYERDLNGFAKRSNEIPMVYNGDAFEIPSNPSKSNEVWYSTKETKANTYLLSVNSVNAVVNYKGTKLVVKNAQQIYDPETKNILQFTNYYQAFPYGGPTAEDIKRANKKK